ncbi:hypothetical protein C804_03501 [Lachnospiraceae bacterium A4]|nr:hypothetical protein C804_03501 [Lachnospiraceae bacterium A4]
MDACLFVLLYRPVRENRPSGQRTSRRECYFPVQLENMKSKERTNEHANYIKRK